MFLTVSILAITLVVVLFLLVLFEPGLKYQIKAPEHPLDADEFLCLLGALSDAQIHRDSRIDVLTNGKVFYEAQLDAIRNAKRSINLEAYIFMKEGIGQRYVEALAERARAGVKVNVVIDAIGSFATWNRTFAPLREAGGRVCWYQPIRWYTLKRFNNRTHRELLIVDGQVGFIGGAGVGDHWYTGVRGHPRWRDTMVRVEGEAVSNLQATFAENWLTTAGELLVGEPYFPRLASGRETAALVVNSTPTMGGSTRARALFQLLVVSARRSIDVTTPYFLPDAGLSDELCRAVGRGVRVRILVPGQKSDHFLTRSTSRAGYGKLLKAGAEIYEYSPAMIHAKVMVVDSAWSVVGSTNFDNRSFGLNDEVNLAVSDPQLAARLESDMAEDLKQSSRVSLEEWTHRPVVQRAPELLGWLFERQQ